MCEPCLSRKIPKRGLSVFWGTPESTMVHHHFFYSDGHIDIAGKSSIFRHTQNIRISMRTSANHRRGIRTTSEKACSNELQVEVGRILMNFTSSPFAISIRIFPLVWTSTSCRNGYFQLQGGPKILNGTIDGHLCVKARRPGC